MAATLSMRRSRLMACRGRGPDRRRLRPIGPRDYSGGECCRALVEVTLTGGDVVTDRSPLAGVANERLRGHNMLPAHWTSGYFGRGADLGRVQRLGRSTRTMLDRVRAWALEQAAGPPSGMGPYLDRFAGEEATLRDYLWTKVSGATGW